jgi:hypothetical protein
MGVGDFIAALIVGLAVPLAIVDGTRYLAGGYLPAQRPGLQLEMRLIPWLLALFAGPGLLIDRLAEAWREDTISNNDLAIGVFIVLGWAWIYGFVLLQCVTWIVPNR